MGLRKLLENLNIIQALPDKPTNTATELKQQFDLSGNKIKTYINEILTEDLDLALSSKANSSDVYTKTETNTLLQTKANSSDVANCKLKGDFAVLTGSATMNEDNNYYATVSYPEGFTESNSVVISFMERGEVNLHEFRLIMGNSNMSITPLNIQQGSQYILDSYKIVLMKIS